MSEENKAAARRWLEQGFEKGDNAVVEEVVAEDVLDHNPLPDQKSGRDGLVQQAETYRSAFPDMSVGVEAQVADGDFVVQRGVASGTNTGELNGMPPTNKKATVAWIDWYRFENGKIAEVWHVEDIAGMLQQLGVLPE